MKKCIFCDIISGKKKDYIVWENKKFMVLMNIRPAKVGHCMLIPKKHIDYLFDMENELYKEFFLTARKIEKPLKRITNAKRIGLSLTGFEIPHAHLHLVPLHRSDELFDKKKFYNATKEELTQMQNQLKKALKKE